MTIAPLCPTPILRHETVQLAHGAGGRLSQALMQRVFMPHLHNSFLDLLDDQAKLDLPPGMVVMRTAFGSQRILDLPLGEQLPRIC